MYAGIYLYICKDIRIYTTTASSDPHPQPLAKALIAHTAALWVQINTGRCGCGGAGLQLLLMSG